MVKTRRRPRAYVVVVWGSDVRLSERAWHCVGAEELWTSENWARL